MQDWHRGTVRFDSGHPLEQLLQHDFHFEPGDGLPNALVQTHAERDVARRIAVEIEVIGVLAPLARVTVRGSCRQRSTRCSPAEACVATSLT